MRLAGMDSFRVEPHWAVVGALHQPVILLILLVVLVVLGGRLYCNTLCPVGTLLGWLSKRAAFRLQIEQKRLPQMRRVHESLQSAVH